MARLVLVAMHLGTPCRSFTRARVFQLRSSQSVLGSLGLPPTLQTLVMQVLTWRCVSLFWVLPLLNPLVVSVWENHVTCLLCLSPHVLKCSFERVGPVCLWFTTRLVISISSQLVSSKHLRRYIDCAAPHRFGVPHLKSCVVGVVCGQWVSLTLLAQAYPPLLAP